MDKILFIVHDNVYGGCGVYDCYAKLFYSAKTMQFNTQLNFSTHKAYGNLLQHFGIYSQIGNISSTKSRDLNVSCFVFQLFLRNLLQPGVK